MRHRFRFAPIALVVLVGSVLIASRADATRDHAAVLKVVEHADTDATTDTGAAGDSVGDILTFANPLYDVTNAEQVGSDQGYCVRVVAGKSYECTWTAFLKHGQVVVNGPFFDAGDSTLAITGGTGKYRDASGTLKLHARPDGKSYDFEYRFVD